MSNQWKNRIIICMMPFVYLLLAVFVVYYVKGNGNYPSGSDTMYHIYRGDEIYRSIKAGSGWPLCNFMWYNGVELFRYWAPLSPFVLAGCQALVHGDALNGYLVFVGCMAFFGGIPWIYIGTKLNRQWLSAFLGCIWFFMPNNLTALFIEGNLARSLSMVFLPLFVFGMYRYQEEERKSDFLLMVISFALMVLCHLGYAGMLALAVLLYLFIYRMIYGRKNHNIKIIEAILLGFLILGVWLVPSLLGGITSMDTSENMASFFQSAWVSINPLYRFENGYETFYFGCAALLLAVFGMLFGTKKTRSGFLTAFITFVCTTSTMYYVLKLLPGSQYLWMIRFISIALCFILISFLYWDTLRTWILCLMCVLLVLDVIPSLPIIYGQQNDITPESRMEQMQKDTLIQEAQEITTQRVALMDESTLGSMGAYLLANWNEKTPGTFGAGWEAANTAENIAQLNKSLAYGKYDYMFDRCINLGNDTVIVKLSQVTNQENGKENLMKAASRLGYELVDENDAYQLYHLNVDGNWGVVTQYQAIGIGSQAKALALSFPCMEESQTDYIDDYTYEELSKYQTIVLADFKYHDKKKAENLVRRLSENGVYVCIMADGIPNDRGKQEQSFLGVRCNGIEFQNGYPELYAHGEEISPDLFPQGYTTWETVYLDGLDEEIGTLYDNDIQLAFYGTKENDHIRFIGLNLGRFYGLTEDDSVAGVLSEALQLDSDKLPEREIVSITVSITNHKIVIQSENDMVNTTFAYHDIFHNQETLESREHLLYVNSGKTVIDMKYPHLGIGILVSSLGVILLLFAMLRKRKQ